MKKQLLVVIALLLITGTTSCALERISVGNTPPSMANIAASDITETSAVITWITDEPATGRVEYGATASYGRATALFKDLVTGHSIILSGLTPATTYHYRVESKDEVGNQRISGDHTFTTTSSGDTTPLVISHVSVSDITSSTVTITWTTDEPATSQVQYGLTASYGSITALDANLVTNHSVILSGLTAATTYHYRVKSKDASGDESISADYTFSTEDTSGASVSIDPASQSVGAGDSFSVDVLVDSDTDNLKACWIDLSYSSAVFTATGIVEGNLLGSPTLTEPGSAISDGTIHYGLTRTSGNPPEPVSGTFITISFTVDSEATPGTYVLDLTAAEFNDENNLAIPGVALSDGEVTVT